MTTPLQQAMLNAIADVSKIQDSLIEINRTIQK
jgi:hypothetical protein